MMYSAAAVVIAIFVVGAALFLTAGKSNTLGPDTTPNPPVGSAVTDVGVAQNGRTLGKTDAKHTIDVWEDFQCPNCRNFTLSIEPQLVANFVAKGDVKLVYHDFIVIDTNTGGHESLDAANAARCAGDQGKFWDYHDWLFTNQFGEGSGAFTKDRLKMIGQMMGGLDLSKFNSCVDNGTHNADVQTESAAHPSSATGTPSIVVDGTLTTSYDYSTVSDALDKTLGITPTPSVPASASASASAAATATPASTPTPAATPSAS
jgi:protein-disulfide isomerase